MKRLLIKLTCAALALCSVLTLSACGKDEVPQESSAATADTAAVATTAAASSAQTDADLGKLHQPVANSDDPFAGFWKITGGVGSDLTHIVYSFDGTKRARLLIGTMGFCGLYELKNKDGKDVFITQLMFGLNGTYTYQFSDDKKTVVLTNIDEETTTTMERQESFSSLPEPVKSPKLDKALLGAWEDDNDEQLYFGSDGVMYNTLKDFSFTFYTYSAADGVIECTYTMREATTEKNTYQVNGDTLTYNGYAYKRISPDQLG